MQISALQARILPYLALLGRWDESDLDSRYTLHWQRKNGLS
jgi:hypothetical protein